MDKKAVVLIIGAGAAGGVSLFALRKVISNAIINKVAKETYVVLTSDTDNGRDAREIVSELSKVCLRYHEKHGIDDREEFLLNIDDDYESCIDFRAVGLNAYDSDFKAVGHKRKHKRAKHNRAREPERFGTRHISGMNNFNGHYRREGKYI